jgi:hypothetical protein
MFHKIILTCRYGRGGRLRAENLSLYTSGVRDTQFLERLAQVLKAGKNAACQRAIGRLLASMKKSYEDGEYESPSQAEFAFRTLVDEESSCQK